MNNNIANAQPSDLIQVIGIDNASQMIWGDGCQVFNLLDTNNLHIIHEIIPSGNNDKMHYHSVAEQFLYLLSGRIKVQFKSNTISLSKYEGVMIPANCAHCVENADHEPAVLLTISSPGKVEDRVLI